MPCEICGRREVLTEEKVFDKKLWLCRDCKQSLIMQLTHLINLMKHLAHYHAIIKESC